VTIMAFNHLQILLLFLLWKLRHQSRDLIRLSDNENWTKGRISTRMCLMEKEMLEAHLDREDKEAVKGLKQV
jgi:hypothetical protein